MSDPTTSGDSGDPFRTQGYRMDPDPATTPGLEPGGGVSPGDTPPGEGSTSQSSGRTPAPRDRQTPLALAITVGLCGLVGVLFLVWAIVNITN